MRKFLQQIARTYWDNEGVAVGEMCFVFPNRRSATFFNHYLGRAANGVLFAPSMFTINDFFAELSGLEVVDKISSLYRLYRHYARLMWPDGEPKESFDQFVYWGDILLSDFDDIDKYMADARLLFANIHDLNEIGSDYASYLSEHQIAAIREFWRNFLGGGTDSPKIQSFRSTWSILFQLYTEFREELESEGLGYEGMIYRKVAGMIKAKSTRDGVVQRLSGYRKIVFVGLNALNECEKTLLDLIRDRLDGDFYWDFEDTRTRDESNKASLFLRHNVTRYPSKYTLQPSLPQRQTFRTFAVPSATGQTRMAHDLLKEFISLGDFDPMETAIVLPDEKLLMPILGAVPQEIESINVTMGYPLGASTAFTFVKFLEHLHRNLRVSRSGKYCFYHRDVVDLLTHPYFCDDTLTGETVQEIIQGNVIYPEAGYLGGKSDLWNKVFTPLEGPDQVYKYLLDLIDAVKERVGALDLEFLFHLSKAVQRIQSLHIPMQLDTCFSLIEQLISSVSVPFEGEPLHGLQIMGPLETRALDFKNIIILSMTEGVFPKRSVSGSFIPYNIRLGFGLPNYEFQDALSSYYFYRSIARAENVAFVYDSTTSGMQSGEASRFIKQLKYHFGLDVNQRAVSFPLKVDVSSNDNLPKVVKTSGILAKIKRRFSASSLNDYIDCPLSFYYKYVEDIDEGDEVVEGLDSSLFGSIFHRTMEVLYEPFAGRELSAGMLLAMADDTSSIDNAIEKAFLEEGKIKEIYGRNMIDKLLIRRFVVQILKLDAEAAPFTLVGTERHLTASLDLADGSKVELHGYVDRVDRRKDGFLHIIDYKTGTTANKVDFKQIEDMFSPSAKRASISFQLFMYAFLALEDGIASGAEECCPTVYALRAIFKGKTDSRLMTEMDLLHWKDCLRKLISEIFDPNVPFTACENGYHCEWCNYKSLCGRE